MAAHCAGQPGYVPTRAEARAFLARQIVRARARGDTSEVDHLLERYALVDELVTSMELLATVDLVVDA